MTTNPAPCLECGSEVTGRFCANCSAEQRAPLRSLQQWWSDTAGHVLDLDIRLLRTLPPLFFSPGFLTVEYAAGRQRRYTPPVRLYVVASAIIIAAMNLLGFFEIEALLANQSAEQRAAFAAAVGADLTDPDVQATFNRRMDLAFPILNLFSPVVIMLLLKLLYPGRYLQEHLAFGCHYATFVAVVTLSPWLVEGVARSILTSVVAIIAAVYLAVAMRRVYRGGWSGLIVRFVVVAVGLLVAITALSTFMFLVVLGTL